MLSNIKGHWRTTLSGVVLGIGHVLLGGRSKQDVAIAIFTAVLGALAKDPNSTH